MNWFGKDWGAPVCRVVAQAATPLGVTCHRCGEKIRKRDRGIAVSNPSVTAWHLRCFLKCTRKPR